MDEKAYWCRRATTAPLARLIMTFLGDPQLAQRLGQAGRKRTFRVYSCTAMLSHIGSVYEAESYCSEQ